MKFLSIDFLRAFCCLIIMFDHIIAFGPFGKAFLGPISNHIAPLSEHVKSLIFYSLGEIAVPIFFLISGFVLTKSRENKDSITFVKGRLKRIYPLVITGTLFSFFLLILANHYFFGTSLKVSLNNVVVLAMNCLLINDVFPMPMHSDVFASSFLMPSFWFMGVMVKYYVLMFFIKKFTPQTIFTMTSIFLIICLAYVCFWKQLPPRLFHAWGAVAFGLQHILFIFLGSALYIVYRHRSSFKQSALSVNLSFILCPVIVFAFFCISYKAIVYGTNLPLRSDMLKNYFLGLVIFVIAIYLSPRIKRVPSPISFLARISFGVYVSHFALGAVLVYVFLKVSFLRENLFFLYVLCFSVIIAFSYLLHLLVEKPFLSKTQIKVIASNN